jgi:NAD(P) transhydrogenase subunit alpha
MNTTLVFSIYVFVLAIFVGFEIISKVPATLHTPLMSGTNAIHGIVLAAAMIVLSWADSRLQVVLGFFAVILGTINVVGGFAVTDRMLQMFKKKKTTQGDGHAS